MKFIDCLEQWTEAGELPANGLSDSLPPNLRYNGVFLDIRPDKHVSYQLVRAGYSLTYADSGLGFLDENNKRLMTPLRETILALCAVINNEIQDVN